MQNGPVERSTGPFCMPGRSASATGEGALGAVGRLRRRSEGPFSSNDQKG